MVSLHTGFGDTRAGLYTHSGNRLCCLHPAMHPHKCSRDTHETTQKNGTKFANVSLLGLGEAGVSVLGLGEAGVSLLGLGERLGLVY